MTRKCSNKITVTVTITNKNYSYIVTTRRYLLYPTIFLFTLTMLWINKYLTLIDQWVQHCQYLCSWFLSGVRQLCLLAKLCWQCLIWPQTVVTYSAGLHWHCLHVVYCPSQFRRLLVDIKHSVSFSRSFSRSFKVTMMNKEKLNLMCTGTLCVCVCVWFWRSQTVTYSVK